MVRRGRHYRNSAIQQTSLTLAPFDTGVGPGLGTRAVHVPRGHAQSLCQLGQSRRHRFQLRGRRHLFGGRVLANGHCKGQSGQERRRHTLATANYGGSRNVPFDVSLENSANFVSVLVNGVRLFANVPAANPSTFAEGRVGLITHWAPGRFDNVQFDYGVFRPCTLAFNEPLSQFWIVSGSWNTNGGTLNSTAVGQSDIVKFDSPCRGNESSEAAGTDQVYSARLLNEYGASGNLVGLVYNYQDPFGLYAGDYFEIVFSPTGIMQLNKFIQGVRYPVATRTHNIPRNTWFDVQVIRSDVHTAVKLNGATVLQLLPQGELRGGTIGVITHWAKGRFDNVSLASQVGRPPSEL